MQDIYLFSSIEIIKEQFDYLREQIFKVFSRARCDLTCNVTHYLNLSFILKYGFKTNKKNFKLIRNIFSESIINHIEINLKLLILMMQSVPQGGHLGPAVVLCPTVLWKIWLRQEVVCVHFSQPLLSRSLSALIHFLTVITIIHFTTGQNT